TWRRTSSSRTRLSTPVILVIMSSSRGPLLVVVVAQRRRQRVRHVRRLGHLRQAQLALDRALHLLLARPAAAGDGLLDARRVVADDRQMTLGGGQEDDAAGVAHEDCGPRMFVMSVELLHRHHSGPILLQHLYYTSVQREETRCHVSRSSAFGGADDAGLAD